MFRFVLAQSKLHVVSSQEGLAKLTIPTWKKLRELWNEQYSEGHKWHYGNDRENRFSRDFYRRLLQFDVGVLDELIASPSR